MGSRYSTIITPPIREKIEIYTLAIRDYYVVLYTDTGLGEAEGVIQSQYIEGADTLHGSIIVCIREKFGRDMIPYTPLESGLSETSFRMGNRRVFLAYEEEDETMTRYITDIEILRK